MQDSLSAWMPAFVIMLTVLLDTFFNHQRISDLCDWTELSGLRGDVAGLRTDIAALRHDVDKLDERVERLEHQRIVLS